ncbi:MAG: potassium channel family protein [Planctomycetota bacterium]|nr:potassium channel family protein [Planctomycetota bacterium]
MQATPLLKSRSVQLLVALIVLILAYPFAELLREPFGRVLSGVCTTLVLLAAVWSAADTRGQRIFASLLLAPSLILFWGEPLWAGRLVGVIIFCFYAIYQLLRRVMSPRISMRDRIVVAMAVYLLAAMTFAFIHVTVWRIDPTGYSTPNSIVPSEGRGTLDMLYFSLVTILSVGYGDIVPVNGFAKMLTVIEAFAGAFFIAILVARLVSLGPREDDSERERDLSGGMEDD